MAPPHQKSQLFARLIGALILFVGMIVLAGWIFDLPHLKSVLPTLVSMKANTAVCFVLIGLAMLSSANGKLPPFGRVCAGVQCLIGALTLLQYATGINFHIDELLFRESLDAVLTYSPGRMAPTTAFNFVSIGVALLLLDAPHRRVFRLGQSLLVLSGLIGLFALIGHTYSVLSLYQFLSFTGMALHTCISFIAISAGIIFLAPDRGIASFLNSDSNAGTVARLLVPVALFVPLALARVVIQLERSGAFSRDTGAGIMLFGNIAALLAAVAWTATIVHRAELARVEAEKQVEMQRRKNEESLLKSEEQFRATFEQAAVGIAHVGTDGNFLRVNERLCAITGYSREELFARTFQDVTFPADLQADLDSMKLLLADKIKTYEMEKRYFRKDGSLIWINLTVSLHRNASGQPEYMISVIEDIMRRKQAEEARDAADAALQKAYRELELRVQARTRELSETNQALQIEIGERKSIEENLSEIISVQRQIAVTEREAASLMELICEEAGKLTRADGAAMLLADGDTLVYQAATGTAVRSLGLRVDVGLSPLCFRSRQILSCSDTSNDPRTDPAECQKHGIGSMIVVPLFEGRNAFGVLKVLSEKTSHFDDRDVNSLEILAGIFAASLNRTKAAAALRSSEERFRTLCAASPIGIFQTDAAGCCLYTNTRWQQIAGLSLDQSLGDGWAVALHPEDKEKVFEKWRLAIGNGTNFAEEFRFLTAAGPRWVSARAAPVVSGDGKLTGFVGTDDDITEKKKAEQEIKASLTEKEILLKEIHHRVKNNMQIITSLLNLQADHIDDPVSRMVYNESQNRVKSMALIHEKLYQTDGLENVDFQEYIKSLTSYLLTSFGMPVTHNIAITVEIPPMALSMDTAIPCGLIVNELVSNSLKYGFAGGRKGEIRIEMCDVGSDRQALIVSDNGAGFPAEIDFRAFKSLGLKLVEALVEQIGGTLERQTEHSPGTRFRVMFRDAKSNGKRG